MVASESNLFITPPADEEANSLLNYYHVKTAAAILRALNNKLRQQIVKAIAENKKITVTELYIKLRLEQSVASQHLAVLRKTKIVLTERDGKFIFYTINFALMNAINEFVNAF